MELKVCLPGVGEAPGGKALSRPGDDSEQALTLLHPSISPEQRYGHLQHRSHRPTVSQEPPSSTEPFPVQQWVSPPYSQHQLKHLDLTGQNAGRTVMFATSFTYQHHHSLHCPALVQLQSNGSHSKPCCSLGLGSLFLA